ncbi:flavin reductase family protein [Flavobacteriaceae bacterium LSUCC0859]|nr:flavin reductase family protein [Flavobacteriaceae bacterium LSUCC0859]
MKQYNLEALEKLPSRFRANLINSCTGYKSVNLIGSKSSSGIENLAIFNSVIHLGSNPALIGFTTRPLTVQRDTYDHIKSSGEFTINAISKDFIDKAHQTAAKYDRDQSEFKAVGLSPEYKNKCSAPFVKESPLKYWCTYVNEYPIKENECILIVGAIQEIHIDPDTIQTDGWIDLSKNKLTAGIGLDGYATPENPVRFEYATTDKKARLKNA